MKRSTLTTAAGVCGVLTALCFVGGAALMIWSGVDGLIPDTGQSAIDWIDDVNGANDAFFGGAWLVVAGGLFGLVALVGFWRPLRDTAEMLILAPILAVVGMTMITVSHLLAIAMAYELVPGYVEGSRTTKDSLAVTTDTLASFAHVVNYVGGLVVFGVVVAALRMGDPEDEGPPAVDRVVRDHHRGLRRLARRRGARVAPARGRDLHRLRRVRRLGRGDGYRDPPAVTGRTPRVARFISYSHVSSKTKGEARR